MGPVQSKAPPPLPPLSEFATGLSEAITPAQAALDGLNSGLFTFSEIFSAVSENVASNGTLMEQAVFGAANAPCRRRQPAARRVSANSARLP